MVILSKTFRPGTGALKGYIVHAQAAGISLARLGTSRYNSCIMTKALILASSSRYRRELLDRLGIAYTCESPDIDESSLPGETPQDTAMRLSEMKARAIWDKHPGAVVIGSDTIVTPDGVKALGKPRDRGDAVRTLTELSGKWHSVCTGIAVIGRAADNTSKKIAETVETKVKFLDLTKEECERYADTGEPLDKAGSYGIQGRGGALVEKIDGDYYSVVGLPVSRLRVILRDKFGINLL